MAKPPVPANCTAAAKAAAGDKLTDNEIADAVTALMDEKERLQRAGQTDRMAERLREFAERRAEQTKIAAALQRRHAALNALVRDRLDRTIDGFVAAGLPPHKAILAIMEGTQRGVEGGRNSVDAIARAYEARYAGGMMRDLQKEVPAFQRLLRDQNFDAAVLREMGEIKDGGEPGITGNRDAQKVAAIFARYAELSRTDLNRLGASIGKLQGWAGAQTHDDVKMIAAGKETWIDYVLPRLDLERTFEGAAPEEARGILADVYDTIITGVPNKPTPREKGARVNPANLAKSLGKSRVLHFRDASAQLQYRDRFGYGNTVSGIVAHLRRASSMAAQMETFGPNPEIMFGSIVESQKRKIKEAVAAGTMDETKAQKLLKPLDATSGRIKAAFDVMSGLATRPDSVNAAKIGADIRAVMAMAKLGGAVITSIPSDLVTAGIASQFRGSGFFRGLTKQLAGIMRGRGSAEQREIAYILGEGFDGIVGHIVSPAAAVDGPVGWTARWQERFFRLNRLTWWTDVARASNTRLVAAEMGMRAGTDYASLPANYRHVLGLHGIDAPRWDALRQAGFEEVNGNKYITPDQIRNLSDDVISPLVRDRLDAAWAASKIDEAKTDATREKRLAAYEEKKATILADGRRDLELRTLAFVADEVSYGTIETDAASRRISTAGATRPGTIAGEAARFIMQFKGFPIAFTQRVVGRAVLGFGKEASKMERGTHIGTIIVGLGMAGYMAMTMKDMMRGYWPPRDPTDPKVWIAALQQGGAMGIYGDFLFGETARSGGDFLSTLAGPATGAILGDLPKLYMGLRDGSIDPDKDVKAADFINFAINNTPFINLFYTRPALDYLVLNAAREWASPGFLKRQERKRYKDYGQTASGPMGFARTRAFAF
jgi:hypothetical protein